MLVTSRAAEPPPDVDTVGQRASAFKVLDLFAGAGGLSAGLHSSSARFQTERAVEWDIEAAASYAQNFGDVVYQGGIEDWLRDEDVPDVDVVVGGPPCQGFSQLGRQDVDDERNTLWRQYLETVQRAKPKAFVMENVPQFLKSPQYPIFVEAFDEKGGPLRDYRFEAAVLNAAHYGAPQTRKRVVVYGLHRDLGYPHMPVPTLLETPMSVRDAFDARENFAAIDEHVAEDNTSLPSGRTAFRGRLLPGVFKASELHFGRSYTELSRKRFRAIPPGGNRFDLPDSLLAPCWRKHKSGSGDVMGRLLWDKPSVTIRTEFFKPEKGRYIHPTQHRAITHWEAARLQGFPDDYRFVGSKMAIARQIGNAVPIPLGAALGTQIAKVLT